MEVKTGLYRLGTVQEVRKTINKVNIDALAATNNSTTPLASIHNQILVILDLAYGLLAVDWRKTHKPLQTSRTMTSLNRSPRFIRVSALSCKLSRAAGV